MDRFRVAFAVFGFYASKALIEVGAGIVGVGNFALHQFAGPGEKGLAKYGFSGKVDKTDGKTTSN
jgi:hypothetical protein